MHLHTLHASPGTTKCLSVGTKRHLVVPAFTRKLVRYHFNFTDSMIIIDKYILQSALLLILYHDILFIYLTKIQY